jgi:hypothetical protein
MASFVSLPPVVGSSTDIHTVAQNALGQRAFDAAGNEYIYLLGVASLVAKDWVFYDESTYQTTRTVANSKGPVAIAQAAVLAAQYGWFGIKGSFVGNVATGALAGKVWVTATAGRVDNTDVAVDLVDGAVQRSATAANLATFGISYPYCLNEVKN